jgi:hypothetical protein
VKNGTPLIRAASRDVKPSTPLSVDFAEAIFRPGSPACVAMAES